LNLLTRCLASACSSVLTAESIDTQSWAAERKMLYRLAMTSLPFLGGHPQRTGHHRNNHGQEGYELSRLDRQHGPCPPPYATPACMSSRTRTRGLIRPGCVSSLDSSLSAGPVHRPAGIIRPELPVPALQRPVVALDHHRSIGGSIKPLTLQELPQLVSSLQLTCPPPPVSYGIWGSELAYIFLITS
jgi:hypothetical protein